MNGTLASLAAALLIAQAPLAQATLIVTTGPGPDLSSGPSLSSSSTGIGQWLAAEFSLATDHYITDIEGWVANNSASGATLAGQTFSISVYGDGGDVPDTNDRRYTSKATITDSAGNAEWAGYHIGFGNGLELTAGDYWAAFEVRSPVGADNDTYGGAMPSPAATPLANYAVNNTGNWIRDDQLAFGVRISGNPVNASAVPAPAPLALLGIGLLALGAIRRQQ